MRTPIPPTWLIDRLSTRIGAELERLSEVGVSADDEAHPEHVVVMCGDGPRAGASSPSAVSRTG